MTLAEHAGNVWIASWVIYGSAGVVNHGAGYAYLSAELDRVKILPDGSNTFDSGAISVMYE
jgi:hypothetical protein